MSVNQITTIELKQAKSSKTNAPGDWNNNISKMVTLNPGDMISCDKVFIDSTPQGADSINIPTQTNLEFKCFIYNVDGSVDQKAYDNPGHQIDGNKYVICNKASAPIIENVELITSITFEGKLTTWGNVTVTFSYRDVNDDLKYYHIFVPSLQVLPLFTATPGVVCKINSWTLFSPSAAVLYSTYATVYQGNTTVPVSKAFTYTPRVFTKNVLLNKGNYTPDFLAKIITDQLTKNNINSLNPGGSFVPVQNEFLFSSLYSENMFFVNSEVPGRAFTYNIPLPSAAGKWIGTNQFALQFSPSNQFYISDIHFPVYAAGSNGVGSKAVKFTAVGGELIPLMANSGVAINNVIAYNVENNNEIIENFWSDNFGFDMSKLAPTYTMVESNIFGSEALIPQFNWNPSVNFTQGLNSTDLGVQKTNAYETCPAGDGLIDLINDATNSIYSNNIFGGKVTNSAYYQVEINSVFKNHLLGQETIRQNISAIVSKYYTNNSYTSASSDAAIPYIHKGEPVVLQGFGCRILDSNGLLAQDLGNDNSIILRITRAEPQQEETVTKK